MTPVAAVAHLIGFLSLRKAQTIEPTTAWTAVSSPSASNSYSFLHQSGMGAPHGRTVVKARQFTGSHVNHILRLLPILAFDPYSASGADS